MKKQKGSNRKSGAKGKGARDKNIRGKAAPGNFAEYFAGVPEAARERLKEMRAVIRAAVPAGATETISYGIPAFRTDKGVLVWFAGFSEHCSLFPKASVIEAFKKELEGYSTSKGTIQFPTGERLPTALIKKIVKARVAEAEREKKR
jgi:uncharacterized protein YdhG (YjbR/CyaY superfamily)